MSIPAVLLCSAMLIHAPAAYATPAVPATTSIGVAAPAVTADQAETTMLNLINAERTATGLPQVQLNDALTEAARIRAQEITVLFSHARPDGQSKMELLAEVGIPVSSYMAENIISGTTESTPESLMRTFMASDAHRAWILSREVNAVGVALCRNEYNQVYAVQMFGCF